MRFWDLVEEEEEATAVEVVLLSVDSSGVRLKMTRTDLVWRCIMTVVAEIWCGARVEMVWKG